MTPEQDQMLSRLENLEKQATPGPVESITDYDGNTWLIGGDRNETMADFNQPGFTAEESQADCDLFAELRNALPTLLTLVREQARALEAVTRELAVNHREVFKSRGVGREWGLECFVCGGEKSLKNNIAAFTNSKEAGERTVDMFDIGARLDYREREPNWIQVKVGACDGHIYHLEALHELTCKAGGYLSRDLIQQAKKHGDESRLIAVSNFKQEDESREHD